jgi:hypothetical protein
MNPMMTLEKQVKIPANRHIHMDVDFTLPEAWTPGEVISLLIRPIPQTESTVEDRLENSAEDASPADMPFPLFRDFNKGLETWDEHIERHRIGNADSRQRTERYRAAIENCWGLAKRMGCTATSDDFLEQRRKDKELEDQLDALHAEERRQAREQRQGRE